MKRNKRSCVSTLLYLQQHLFALLEFAAFEKRSSQVEQHLGVLILVEFLQAILVLWRPRR